jgi:LytS/YehU family sensor histidine kinase
MLVENALQHGIAPRPAGGELVIRAVVEKESLAIEVINPGQLAESEGSGTKMGLKNTRERLRISTAPGPAWNSRIATAVWRQPFLIPRTVSRR